MTLIRLTQLYRTVALIVLNTLILLLLLNASLLAFFLIKDRLTAKENRALLISEDRMAALQKVYPNLHREQIQALITEMTSFLRTYVYDPFTELKERPYAGKYLNEDENGFRRIKYQGPWPPDSGKYFTVFLFGGSTTFGFGVPDEQTIASYLQEYLSEAGLDRAVRVYNFGRTSYYSTQERILFERLITAGFIPDLAIFIDGLNDFYYHDDQPRFAERFKLLFEGQLEKQPTLLDWCARLPMVRAARSLRPSPSPAVEHRPLADESYKNQAVLMRVIERYTKSKRMIEAVAAAHGIKAVFVWQPISLYKYDLRYHLFANDLFGKHAYARYGYALMAEFVQRNPQGDNFLWRADMQEQASEPLYVDSTHYSGKMSKIIAHQIYVWLKVKNLLPGNT